MKRENYSKVYIVKLPNSFCGIGACVIDHPKKVTNYLSHPGADLQKVATGETAGQGKFSESGEIWEKFLYSSLGNSSFPPFGGIPH